MTKIVLITGASSGFGRLTAEAIARVGHVVYGSMRQTATRNAAVVKQMAAFSRENHVDLRALELDVQSQDSVDAAVKKVIAEQGRIDVLIHNAGHMVFGPAEAFTPEQYAELYDVNVLSTQRVNRAVLPHQEGARPPGLGFPQQFCGRDPALPRPLLRRKGRDGRHCCAICAGTVTLGIETSIIVPGAFISGTNHFAHSGRPADAGRAAEYEAGPYNGFGELIQKAFAAIVPPDADAGAVAEAIVNVVDTPFGKRPFRVHIDPAQDGADVGFTVLDRVRAEMLHRVGLSDLLKPRTQA